MARIYTNLEPIDKISDINVHERIDVLDIL